MSFSGMIKFEFVNLCRINKKYHFFSFILEFLKKKKIKQKTQDNATVQNEKKNRKRRKTKKRKRKRKLIK